MRSKSRAYQRKGKLKIAKFSPITNKNSIDNDNDTDLTEGCTLCNIRARLHQASESVNVNAAMTLVTQFSLTKNGL